MGEALPHQPVLLIAAVFSRHPDAFAWAAERLQREWGELALRSERWDFTETRYYDAPMGTGLQKELWAFATLIDPATLPSRKLDTNAWEEVYRQSHPHPESRPLNLDPGYLTEAKLVLATTKDRDHRLYLCEGIFAEVTLVHQRGRWQARPWTYPDYQRADYHQFLTRCRDYLRQRYGKSAGRGTGDRS